MEEETSLHDGPALLNVDDKMAGQYYKLNTQ